jgi:hypothetical protein
MSKGASHAAWFIAVALSLSGSARAQAPTSPPPDGTPPAAASATPPAAVTPLPPPATSFARRPFLELSTLRMLHDKGVISTEEYERSAKDFTDWLGVKGDDSMTFALCKWKTTIYGFVEGDAMWHSTQSINSDFTSNSQIAKPGTYAGTYDRFQFTARDSRLGFRLAAPDLKNLKASGVFEMDFLGPGALAPGQGFVNSISTDAKTGAVTASNAYNGEQGWFVNPVLRIRHAYLKMETPIVDILIGQTWQLAGFNPYYIPAILQFPGTVGGLFGRTPQLRVSHTFKSKPVNFEIAVAMLRGAQRDSGLPEGQAGLRLTINNWSGLHSSFLAATSVAPLSIAVSGAMRSIRVPEWSTPDGTGVPAAQAATGWLLAVDAYIPLLPAKNTQSASLSIMGEFAQGEGINDLYTGLTGGVGAFKTKTGAFVGLDPGLAIFDSTMPKDHVLTLIGWRTYMANLEFFVPGTSGRLCIFGMYGHSEMTNAQKLFGKNSGQPSATSGIRDHEDMIDAGAFFDVYPGAVRLAVDYQYLMDYYVDSKNDGGTLRATNAAIQGSGFLFF